MTYNDIKNKKILFYDTNTSRLNDINAFMKKHHKNEYKISSEIEVIRHESKIKKWDYIVSVSDTEVENTVRYLDMNTFVVIMKKADNEELIDLLGSSKELIMEQNEIDDLFKNS